MRLFLLSSVLFLSFSVHAIIDHAEEPMTAQLLLEVTNQSQVTEMDDLPGVLPDGFLINFILKHGIKEVGPRGHLVEKDVSQSSDPELPRAVIFDERSGFSISYNGGGLNKKGQKQSHDQRLDVLSFNDQTKQFKLDAITFHGHNPGQVKYDKIASYPERDQCTRCHGPRQRPIFSMYPDWPTFYGSDNDELLDRRKRHQVREYRDFQDFVRNTVPNNKRYTPLFSNERSRKYLNRSLRWYPSFPYRPSLEGNLEHPSRAFSFRPGLRMGILYNRLMAQHIAEIITKHERYEEYGEYFLFNLLQCHWQNHDKRDHWLSKISTVINGEVLTRSGGLLDYRQNLSIFGLRVNDVDMRFSYNHSGYERKSNRDQVKDVMGVGYVGERYFNSYFDGSATIDELLSYQLYSDMLQKGLRVRLTPRSLVGKYGRRRQRMALDRDFFEQMDAFSQWIPIAYPREPMNLGREHHREGYPRRFRHQHTRLCNALENRL